MSPLDRRHGTYVGYNAGCREACCRAALAARLRAYRKVRYLLRGEGMTLDGTGTARRLQALAALGWPTGDLAKRLGITCGTLRHTRAGRYPRVRRGTFARVCGLYDELSMTLPPPSQASSHTRTCARASGWLPPLAWDDDTIDDANTRPYTEAAASKTDRKAALIEDVEWMLETNTHPVVICDRLGIELDAMGHRMQRYGRRDLARIFEVVVGTERRAVA